jgi:hypothetical protein
MPKSEKPEKPNVPKEQAKARSEKKRAARLTVSINIQISWLMILLIQCFVASRRDGSVAHECKNWV